MIEIGKEFSREPEQPSVRGNDSHSRLMELQAENQRLQQLVTELLIRNQQLREQASANRQE
jgi:hypothetical protein